MQRRTRCCPLQMVQYLSQVQRSSGKSHCMQTVGACIRPSVKTVPEPWSRGKAKVGRIRRVVYLFAAYTGNALLAFFSGHTNGWELWQLDAIEVAAGILAGVGIEGWGYCRRQSGGEHSSRFRILAVLDSRKSSRQ